MTFAPLSLFQLARTFTSTTAPYNLRVHTMQSTRALGRIRGVMLDVSGTLHIESLPTPSAVTALNRLSETDLVIRFVTNTTKESKKDIISRLTEMGFNISPQQVFTSLTATRMIIQRERLTPYLLLEDSAMEEFAGIECDSQQCNAVVIGLAPSKFNYEHLNKAFRFLLNGAKLIAIHQAKYYKQLDGLSLGPGPFVTALEQASGVTAECIGKPEASFFHSVLDDMECGPEETIMIGDDVLNDIEGAQKIGMRGILVKTGKYRAGDEGIIQPPPSTVCDDFTRAVEHIITHLKHSYRS